MENSRQKGKKGRNKKGTIRLFNLSIKHVRSSVVAESHNKSNEGESSSTNLKKEGFNISLLGKDHFPALQQSQKMDRETKNLQKTANAKIFSMPSVLPEEPEIAEINTIPAAASEAQPTVIPSRPVAPSESPLAISKTQRVKEKVDLKMKHLPVKLATNQHDAESVTSAGCKKTDLPAKEDFFSISESKFLKTMEGKDKQISEVQQQNATLLSDVERLTAELKQKKMMQLETSSKILQLEREKCQEKEQRENDEMSLAKEKQETSKVKSSLVQIKTQLETQCKESLKEEATFKRETEELKQQLQLHKSQVEKEKTHLYVELDKKTKLHADATSKVDQLESVFSAERNKKKQAEANLVQQIEESGKLKATLVQTQREMAEQKCQWQKEKSLLLAEHVQTVSNMKTGMIEAQEVLEKKQEEWSKEKASLQGLISTIKKGLDEKEEEIKTTTEILMDRVGNLEEQLENMLKEKSKKKSLWQRFIQLFK